MGNPVRILIADASPDQTALLREVLEGDEFEVTAAVNSGDEAYRRLLETGPDVLLTDLLLPCLDGLSLLRRLKAEAKLPHTIILTAFWNDRMARSAMHLGVDDYLPKPCRADVLCRRIREVMDCSGETSSQVDPAVRAALIRIRVPTHLDGYKYLCEGLSRALEDRSCLQGVTKALYRDIAKAFHTNSACVERSMRTAITAAWQKGSAENRRRCFGAAFDGDDQAPSNIRFISAMAEYIELTNSIDAI